MLWYFDSRSNVIAKKPRSKCSDCWVVLSIRTWNNCVRLACISLDNWTNGTDDTDLFFNKWRSIIFNIHLAICRPHILSRTVLFYFSGKKMNVKHFKETKTWDDVDVIECRGIAIANSDRGVVTSLDGRHGVILNIPSFFIV